MVNLRKYFWKFFGFYSIFYLVGFSFVLVIDHLSGSQGGDLLLAMILSTIIPRLFINDFIKKENRFFNNTEQKKAIRITAIIATIITSIFQSILCGVSIFVKLLVAADQLSIFLDTTQLPIHSMLRVLINTPMPYLILILVGGIALYGAIAFFGIRRAFKTTAKLYAKKISGLSIQTE